MAFCTECGKTLTEGSAFCTECGTPVTKISVPDAPAEAPAEPEVSASIPAEAPASEPPVTPEEPVISEPEEAPVYGSASSEDAPPPKGKYSVVSTGAFFWLTLLFAIPVIGWIACLIMAFAPKNLNLKNFAKAHLIWIIVGIILCIILLAAIYWLLNTIFADIEQMFAVHGGDIEDIIEQYIRSNYGVML